ncbi:class II aldolase/adducin family protein [Sphingobacteriales bacterium UPWRP_1]|nr:hypothetical protein BVG80_12140 [Sphingobacteriales bacterium TSM_CSM]PSJ75842.1 class II aldolase/adducin family protein [Sphingobacteriales bacterium UPWRP_1]
MPLTPPGQTHNSEEGYIKYRCIFTPSVAPKAAQVALLNPLRTQLHRLGLIGVYSNGIGYGNISARLETSAQFIISGTQTGHLPELEPQHYSIVNRYSIYQNTVYCSGCIKASSEALTHAAVYELNPAFGVVIHVHHAGMWQRWLNVLPTTQTDIPYGTPQMANEIKRLYAETNLPEIRVLTMAGHTDGLLAFGYTGNDAFTALLKYYKEQ